jgi:SAM-dependent methyltransferase
MKALLKKTFAACGFPVTKGLKRKYRSETSKCRERLSKFCVGYGVDLGFGGDPIVEHAIRVDQSRPYAETGANSVQLGGDATNLHWFRDEVLDFVFSSHLLEDFEDTEAALREWMRVLKPGGVMIIYCPDEQVYRTHCARTGQTYNVHHKHADFSLEFVKQALRRVSPAEIVHEMPLVEIYSWELVCRKRK